jgi:hypothetical protein
MSLANDLKKQGAKKLREKREPLWKGPEKDGITFSLLSRFLVCRERFRVRVIEGLGARETFSPPIHYGNMWHVCEEAIAAKTGWKEPLRNYIAKLAQQFPMQREDINHWYGLCLVEFPAYVEHWSKHPDVKKRTPLLQEQKFAVPYQLPSGRVVTLKGKWDSVDLIEADDTKGIYIQENKTKSRIDDEDISRQLRFDLQTMLYVIALDKYSWEGTNYGPPKSSPSKLPLILPPLCGVRYNVVRRSAHKSVESFTKKLNEDIADKRAGEWFARWKVEISQKDIEIFKKTCFDPILEQLWDWWEWVEAPKESTLPRGSYGATHVPLAPVNWRHPYGVWNSLNENGSTEYDNYLVTSSEIGLQRISNLFPELE